MLIRRGMLAAAIVSSLILLAGCGRRTPETPVTAEQLRNLAGIDQETNDAAADTGGNEVAVPQSPGPEASHDKSPAVHGATEPRPLGRDADPAANLSR